MADPAASTASSTLTPGESPGGTTITVDVPKSFEVPTSSNKTPITLRSPLKYNPTLPSSTNFTSPSPEWLQGTWCVTHSTLPMWRKAKNVRITYKIIPPSTPTGPTLLDDEVTSEPTQRTFLPQPKSIKGVDTPDGDGAWNWRGKGSLRIATSHWEVLGWGERADERWAVTWFAPTMFTPAGLDIYCSKEGISEGLLKDVVAALEGLEAKEIADLAKAEMKEVKIDC